MGNMTALKGLFGPGGAWSPRAGPPGVMGSDARASEFDVRVFRALRRTDEPQTNTARLNTSW